jgi:hypothetical protein
MKDWGKAFVMIKENQYPMSNSPKKLALIFLMVTITSGAFASVVESGKLGIKTELIPTEKQKLINRLEEIKLIDSKLLTRKEKRELRHEKAALQDLVVGNRRGNGLYISAGLIILIVILILIL